MVDLKKVYSKASAFRKAIESLGVEKLGLLFRAFPAGCCGNTSLMLGAYLSTEGLGEFDYVSGIRGKQSHAWLEKEGIIVDITSDQFKKGMRVYVGTTNRFYKHFRVEYRRSWNTSLDGGSIQTDRLYPAYISIINQIKKHATI